MTTLETRRSTHTYIKAMGVSRQQRLLNNSKVKMHDWCGTFHFHTFKRSLLASAPNRPSGLYSSKPGMDLAFLVMLPETRVALFCGGGTGGSGWDSTPVFAPYPIIESCMLFWARGTKCLTHEELRVKNFGSQFDVAGKPEKPLDQPGRVQIYSRTYDFKRQAYVKWKICIQISCDWHPKSVFPKWPIFSIFLIIRILFFFFFYDCW